MFLTSGDGFEWELGPGKQGGQGLSGNSCPVAVSDHQILQFLRLGCGLDSSALLIENETQPTELLGRKRTYSEGRHSPTGSLLVLCPSLLISWERVQGRSPSSSQGEALGCPAPSVFPCRVLCLLCCVCSSSGSSPPPGFPAVCGNLNSRWSHTRLLPP